MILSVYNPAVIEQALKTVSPSPPFPRAAERAAWEQIAETIGAEKVEDIRRLAEADLQAPLPVLTATLYLDFQRTGERYNYQTPQDRRREMLRNLTLAECLEGQGRFLDPILDLVWAICEESTWARPAHERVLPDMAYPFLDLNAATTALELAEVDALVGAQLDSALGKRIRYEVNRRCFEPYLSRHDHHWMYTIESPPNNWAAVCNAGIVGAAIYLESDLARLAEIVARGFRSLDDYLAGFDMDGGTTEGPFCWSYGFGYYTVLAHLIEHRTGSAVDLFRDSYLHEIAQFPVRTALNARHCANFSDCEPHFTHIPAHLVYLSQRLNLPQLMRLARVQPPSFREKMLIWGLRSLFWRPAPEPDGAFTPAHHDWFRGMLWMVARQDPADPNGLVLAAKGGHNGEMHNQNDLGNFIIHFNDESLIADIGRGRFTKQYFAGGRYDYFVNSSKGHSVPVVNGYFQLAGREHEAHLLEHEVREGSSDTLFLELKSAYPAQADLISLRRRLTLHRQPSPGWVELQDTVQFAAAPGILESVLITLSEVKIGEGELMIEGLKGTLRINFDPEQVAARVELQPGITLPDYTVDVRRVILSLREPLFEGEIRVKITPLV